MPAYKDRGKWRYRKRIRLQDGRTIRIGGTSSDNTKAAAETAEREHIRRALSPEQPKRAMTMFEDFSGRWLATQPLADNNRASTIEVKNTHVRVHLIPLLGKMPLTEITNAQLVRLASTLAGPRKPRTVRAILQTLHKMLASALDWELIDRMPKFPKPKMPPTEFDFYTSEEMVRLLGAIDDLEDRARIMFACKSGARVGEQSVIEWGDLDLHAAKIHIRRSIHRGVIQPPKSGRHRTVPMSGDLREALQAIRHLRSPLVFCDIDGRRFKAKNYTRLLEKYARRAGLRVLNWHALRHTFASHLVMKRVPLKQVQEWLGHGDIKTTMIYSHLSPDYGDKLINVLDQKEETCQTSDAP